MHVIEELSYNTESMIIDMFGEKEWKEIRAQHEKDARGSLMGKMSGNKLIKLALGRLGGWDSDELLYDKGHDSEIVVQAANVVEEIIAQSESKGCGMIIMAYRSRNMLVESIIGGVCRKVLRRSKKPVLHGAHAG